MSEHKPHHQLIHWALEAAPVFDWGNVSVGVCREAFALLVSEGMEEKGIDRIRRHEGVIQYNGIAIWVFEHGASTDTAVFCQNHPIHTLQLSAHQKLAWAAMCDAAGRTAP